MAVMTIPSATSSLATSAAVRVILPERAVRGKPLGRHIYHDPRSRRYPAARAPQLASVVHPSGGLPFTQDDDHTCSTAHSLCAVVNCLESGQQVRQALTEQDAVSIYRLARQIEGTDAGNATPGSSGLMACKAARSMGIIRSYGHAFGLRHALEALVLSPVITGFRWYTSFDSPDPRTGLVEIKRNAVDRGGHEVVAHAIDSAAGIVWFWNSWGPEFGLGGRFCMTFETWGRLLEDQGDVTVPVV
jgi:hypothetical protein